MTGKVRLVDVKDPSLPGNENEQARTLRLVSGREVKVSCGEHEDLVEIFEPAGELTVRIRLTPEGPVMVVQGCKLALRGAESIALEAPTVEIAASEKARVASKGSLEIDAARKMEIHSEDDIRVTGKIIRLN